MHFSSVKGLLNNIYMSISCFSSLVIVWWLAGVSSMVGQSSSLVRSVFKCLLWYEIISHDFFSLFVDAMANTWMLLKFKYKYFAFPLLHSCACCEHNGIQCLLRPRMNFCQEFTLFMLCLHCYCHECVQAVSRPTWVINAHFDMEVDFHWIFSFHLLPWSKGNTNNGTLD